MASPYRLSEGSAPSGHPNASHGGAVVHFDDSQTASPDKPRRLSTSPNRSRVISLHSAERINSISVPDAERKISPADGGLHSFYKIRVATTRRNIVVEKRFSELCAAHEQLLSLFPHRFLRRPGGGSQRDSVRSGGAASDGGASSVGGRSPASGSGSADDVIVDVDLRDPALRIKRRTSRTMEARRTAMETYLRQAICDPSMAALILTVLAGPEGAPVVAVEEEEGEEDEEEYGSVLNGDGESTLGGSTPVRPLSQMLSIDCGRHGLIMSASAGGGRGQAGSPLLPYDGRTNIGITGAAKAAAADDGYVPAPATITFAAKAPRENETAASSSETSIVGSDNIAFAPGAKVPFSLDDMDAFDCLLEHGYAVIVNSSADSSGTEVPSLCDRASCSDSSSDYAAAPGALPQPGQSVVLSFASCVWDGAESSAVRLDAVSRAEFVLGDQRDCVVDSSSSGNSGSAVPPGLHTALCRVPVGSSATVVLSPELAFGEDGVPPLCPGGAHLVLHLQLHSASGQPRDMSRWSVDALKKAADEGGGSSGFDAEHAADDDKRSKRRSFGTGGRVRISPDVHPVEDDELAAWEAGAGLSVSSSSSSNVAASSSNAGGGRPGRPRVILVGPDDDVSGSSSSSSSSNGQFYQPSLPPPHPPVTVQSSSSTFGAPAPFSRAAIAQAHSHAGQYYDGAGGADSNYGRGQPSLMPPPPPPVAGWSAAGGYQQQGQANNRSHQQQHQQSFESYDAPSSSVGSGSLSRSNTAPPHMMQQQVSATASVNSSGNSNNAGGGLQRAADGSLMTASGLRLPNPEEAERAFKAYLASIGAPIPGETAPPLPSHGIADAFKMPGGPSNEYGSSKSKGKGKGLLRHLSFGGGGGGGGGKSKLTSSGSSVSFASSTSAGSDGAFVSGTDGAGEPSQQQQKKSSGLSRLLGGKMGRKVFSSHSDG